MPPTDTNTVLNRVLAILERSFPQYLLYARPYVPSGREGVMQTVEQIVVGQNALAERVAQQILDSGGRLDHGDFPIEFTDTHDLGIDFLLQEAIDCLKQDAANLQECADALRSSSVAQSLASEAIGLMKGHLEQLQKIVPSSTGSIAIELTPAHSNEASISTKNGDAAHRHEEGKQLASGTGSPG
ncbi:MAG TPA: hypothetical protein VFW73_07630 [Lacipirellulaceae bacterium]|nr:hypothetical protein [Lacipirellulaceae bacterium]